MSSIITDITVRIGDINYGGHLGHDRLISLLHQARLDFLQVLGANELDFFGCGLIMHKLECDYLGEAFLGDLLQVEMTLSNIRPTRFTLHYHITRQSANIARASTTMVAFDYQVHKVCPLPTAFITALTKHNLGTVHER